MAIYTLRPNANWNNESLFTISGGSASVHAALADDSDSTFITRTSTSVPASYETEFGTQALSATEQVVSVNLRAKIVVGTAGIAQFSLGVITDRNGRTVFYSVPITKLNTLALSTVDFALNMTSAPNGAVWTQTLIDNLVAKFADNATASGDRTSVYEMYVDVVTTARPTVTVTAPTGTITATSFPSVVWSYADADGDPQSAYEIKIFDAATYGASGFSPDTSTPVVGTGIVTSSNGGQTLEADLANATTYRAYVRVAQLSNGNNFFSAYAFSQFSLSVDAPATPTVSAFYEADTGSVTITIFGRSNVLNANQASLETNTDGWVALTNCSVTRSTAQASDGAASLALTATASGDMVATTTTATAFAVTPSTKFSATAEFRSAVTPRSTAVGIVFRNSAGATISTVFGTEGNDSTSAFTQRVVTAVAPVTAVTALVAVKVVTASTSEVHFVDKIAFHAGDEPFWTRGGFSNFSFDVERSDNGSSNFSAIRNSPVTASSAQIATIRDFEPPIDTTVTYRSKGRAEI
jgi:hypothetical protein